VFPGLALLIGSAVAGVVTWIAVGVRAGKLEALAKPATIVLLLAWFAWRLAEVAVFPGIVLAIALAASLAGDILLLRPRRRLMAGMGAFLIAQLAYTVAFNADGLLFTSASARIGVSVLAVGVGGFAVLSRKARWHKRKGLKGATVIYTASLALMLWSAVMTTQRPEWTLLPSALVVGGAAVFCLSDSVLGWVEFVRPSRKGLVFVMVTYHLAQWAIALGYSARLGAFP
jgi:uncharacterized membrane protein YhhN